MLAKGVNLNYVAPIVKNEIKLIELNKEEVIRAIEESKQALIMYVVGDSPAIAVFERHIEHQVNTVRMPKVYYHNDDFILMKLSSMDGRNEILYLGPHMLNSCPIIVKVWSADLDFNKAVLQIVPVWVKYPNLPLNCWSMDSLSRVVVVWRCHYTLMNVLQRWMKCLLLVYLSIWMCQESYHRRLKLRVLMEKCLSSW